MNSRKYGRLIALCCMGLTSILLTLGHASVTAQTVPCVDGSLVLGCTPTTPPPATQTPPPVIATPPPSSAPPPPPPASSQPPSESRPPASQPPAGPGPGPAPAPPPPPPASPAGPPPVPPPGAPAQLAPGSPLPALQVPNIVRTKSNNTARLVQILQQSASEGIQVEPAMYAPFPVAGLAYYSHDFGFPRYTPYPHLHEGTDIFADPGTPLIATGPGVIAGFGNQAVGGLSVWISGDDGVGFYYTHMSGFAPGLQAGMRVEGGTVIGYVGNTGNAASTPHHVHFEIHPPVKDSAGRILAGGATATAGGLAHTNTEATDPKFILDAWLDEAVARAEQRVGEVQKAYAEIPDQVHFARRVNEIFTIDEMERPIDLLWYSPQQVELGALGLARQAAAEARLSPGVGSIAQRTAEGQRLAAIRLAVRSPYLQTITFTGSDSLAGALLPGESG